MNICSTEDIRKKEVINLCDGARLGCATDFEISVCDAKILALIIPSGGWLGIGKGDCIVIPWENIDCIGEDTILVKLESLTTRQPNCGRKKHKC